MITVCFVPTLTAHASDWSSLLPVWKQCSGDNRHIEFDFSACRFLRPQGIAFLGGLARRIECFGGRVSFRWATLSPAVRAVLAQNGFIFAFDGQTRPWQGTSIPYLHHQLSDPEEFSAYVQQSWLGRGWLGISSQLSAQIASNIGEAYVNAFEHSNSPVGVHCCGQYFPQLKILSLTLVDFGVGIPEKVRAYWNSFNYASSYYLQWAFQAGASTRVSGSGGLGLDNLRAFVSTNRGALDIYSNDSAAILKKEVIHYEDCVDSFPGTMITVRLRCDDRYYVLGSELASFNPFETL